MQALQPATNYPSINILNGLTFGRSQRLLIAALGVERSSDAATWLACAGLNGTEGGGQRTGRWRL